VNLGRVFVDAGAWFAIQVSDDAHHNAARRAFPVILEGCRSLVTSNLAFDVHFRTAGFPTIPGDVRILP